MRGFRSLLMLIGALATLLMGATAPASAAEAASPPCHEAMRADSHLGAGQDPDKPALKVMACCVACVAAPRIASTGAAEPGEDAGPPGFRPAQTLSGRVPAPEPDPPRARRV